MAKKKATKTSKRKHPKKRAFLTALARLGTKSAAAREVSISRSTFWNWERDDPEFAEGVVAAMEEFGDSLEQALFDLVEERNVTAVIFALKGAKPEKYRERHETKHTGDPNNPIHHSVDVNAVIDAMQNDDEYLDYLRNRTPPSGVDSDAGPVRANGKSR